MTKLQFYKLGTA